MKLDICMLVTYDLDEDGGVKHHAFALAEAHRRRGHRVSIVGPCRTPPVGREVHGFRGVVDIQANGSNNPLGIFVRPWSIWRWFAARRFDVIHIHEPLNPTLPYWATWMTPRTPHVATFHAYRDRRSAVLNAGRKLWSAPLFPFIQRGIAVSPLAEGYARETWRRPLSVIPNGVDTELFRPGPAAAPAGGDGDAPLRLLFVGRLADARKGLYHLLDAYQILRAQGLNVALDVVGENRGLSLLQLPGVTYHGSIPIAAAGALAERYRACDVFVAPSTRGESFGMILLEAMASGRPIVCSDVDGYRQVVDDAGAVRVPPRDGAALAAAIAALARDPERRARMGACNRRRAAAFDWSHVAQRVRAEYREAMAAHEREGAPWALALQPTRRAG